MKIPKIKLLTKRNLIILAIIVIAIIVIASNLNKSETIETTTVKKGDIKQTVSSSGSLSGKDTLNLRFNSLGKLSSVNVRVGDKVYQGQVLATLDSQKLSIEEQIAQNNLRDKTTMLDKILDDIHLFQYGNGGFSNVGSINETFTQKQLRTSAEVLKDNAFDQIKLSERAFEDSVLISPLSGVVTRSDFFPGQFVSSSDVIVQVIDNSQVFFEAEVDEADISKISLNQEAEVSLNAYPEQTFKAKVAQIFPTTKTTSSGATVVIVKIKLENIPRFTQGLNGQAEIILKEVKNVLVIPQDSLKADDKVVIKDGENLNEVTVKTGLKSDSEAEIVEGLREGQVIVKNPSVVQLAKGFFQKIFRRS